MKLECCKLKKARRANGITPREEIDLASKWHNANGRKQRSGKPEMEKQRETAFGKTPKWKIR